MEPARLPRLEFLWKMDTFGFRPQRTALRFEVKLPNSDETSRRLEEAGLEVLEYDTRWGYYKLRLSAEDVEKHRDLLTSLVKEAFERQRVR